METRHEVHVADARALDGSADLVITSPPYPMIEMWDEVFAAQDPEIDAALEAKEGDHAFSLMHDLLDEVWARLADAVREGGVVCINVGDATRNLGAFQQYPNAAEITRRMRKHGFLALPDLLWRKPTNSGTKFMGSGMLPTNAYPTLEHEHILLFRKGDTRDFPAGDDARYESAYFWEERNRWFSDCWEIAGERQRLDGEARDRSGAFPFAVPYRLVQMFSVYGDTVLDPFWGTGTTSLAALVSGRHSVGYERDGDLVDAFAERVGTAPGLSEEVIEERLASHRSFVGDRDADYEATHYDFEVVTRQEQDVRFYAVDSVERDGRTWTARHRPV